MTGEICGVGAPAAARTWDAHATSYARQERFEARAIAAALRLSNPGSADRLVDLATGTGLLLRTLAARDRRPRAAIGIDHSAGMLAQIGRLPEDWRVIRGDARCVPLPAGDADVITCCYLLHLLGEEDRGRVLREARRLLRAGPGSRLVIVTVWADRGTAGGRALVAGLRGLAVHFPRRWGGLMPLDPTAELADAGLVVMRRVVLTRGGYPSLVLRARAA